MAATLGAHLVFGMKSGSAEFDQRFDGACQVECARAEPCIYVDQQRQVADVGDTANVGEHVVERGDAEVGNSQ